MLSTLILKVINKLYKLYGIHKRLDPRLDSVLLLGDGLDQFDKALCQLLVVKYECRVLHLGPSKVSRLDDFDNYQWFQCDFSKKESLHDAMHRVSQLPKFPSILINDLDGEIEVDASFGVSPMLNLEQPNGNRILGSILTIRMFLQLSLPKEEDLYIINIIRDPSVRKNRGTRSKHVSTMSSAYAIRQLHDGLSEELALRDSGGNSHHKTLLIYVSSDATEGQRHTKKSPPPSSLSVADDCIQSCINGRRGIITGHLPTTANPKKLYSKW